ncbi:MAG: hypothetical protein ACJ76N_31520 [Thermoanaerobaculia bacterium]
MSVRSLAVSLRGMVICGLAALFLTVLARPAGATVITASPVDFTAPEQSLFSGTVATFTDDDPAATPDSFVTIIDWGDGSSSSVGTITDSGGGNFVVSGQHTYDDEGTFSATVSIFDQEPGEGSASVTDTATITEADVLSGTPVIFPAPAGVSFTTTVANFSDTLTSAVASDFMATIDWGDATTSAGTVSGGGSFQVSGTHTYASPGNYPVVVTLSDDPPGTATAKVTSTAQVTAGLFVTAGDFSTPEGTAFNGTVATFADSDLSKTPASFTVTIDWGDGTSSAGTVSGGPGSFTVTGQHTYADEGAFSFTVTVTETGPGGATDSSSATATVTEADALSGSPVTFAPQATLTFSGTVATFTDTNTANVAGDFTATIDWGDGTTTAGTVSGGGGTFTVSGTHTYASPGSFPVIVTLTDDPPGTATATVTSTANVAAAPVPVPALDLRGLLALGAALAAAALFRLRSRSGAA